MLILFFSFNSPLPIWKFFQRFHPHYCLLCISSYGDTLQEHRFSYVLCHSMSVITLAAASYFFFFCSIHLLASSTEFLYPYPGVYFLLLFPSLCLCLFYCNAFSNTSQLTIRKGHEILDIYICFYALFCTIRTKPFSPNFYWLKRVRIWCFFFLLRNLYIAFDTLFFCTTHLLCTCW